MPRLVKWYTSDPDNGLLVGNTKEIETFVAKSFDGFGEYARFFVKRPASTDIGAFLSRKTVLKIISRGHSDSQVFMYVNPLKSSHFFKKNSGGSTYVSVSWNSVSSPKNWVLDLDGVPNCTSITELLKKMESTGCPLPSNITQTGPSNFHALYLGIDQDWPLSKRLKVCLMLCGNPKVSTIQDIKRTFKENGVDYSYLIQNIEKAKMRVPGCINEKYTQNKKPFVCSGWANKTYLSPAIEHAEIRAILGLSTKKIKDFWKNYVDRFDNLLFSNCGKYSMAISVILSKNLTRLKRGDFRINQIKMANEIGATQPHVSRLLKSMISRDILIVTKEFSRAGGKSRTYGLSDTASSKIFIKKRTKRQHDFNRPYGNGMTNILLLRDIRELCKEKRSIQEITDFCMLKITAMPLKKQRSRKDIEKIIIKWYKRTRPEMELGIAI